LFDIFKSLFLDDSHQRGVIDFTNLTIAGDGMPLQASARERKKRLCKCKDEGTTDCDCLRYFSQPDCDIGWDSSRDHHYNGYHVYSLTVANSESDLPLFPMLQPASRHDSLGFVHTWFNMKSALPTIGVHKLLLDAAHDAMPIFEYCQNEKITPFIDLNKQRGRKPKYKDDFILDDDGVPICKAGLRMNKDGKELGKRRLKYRCPLTNRKLGNTCSNPCSDSLHGRTVHLAMKDNPRLINIPPRNSKEWNTEYNARISAERNNKRQKIDYKLECGKHRSTREWYCRLYGIMMLQHLDAWDLPFDSTVKQRIKQAL
jgi:hypothetical protein